MGSLEYSIVLVWWEYQESLFDDMPGILRCNFIRGREHVSLVAKEFNLPAAATGMIWEIQKQWQLTGKEAKKILQPLTWVFHKMSSDALRRIAEEKGDIPF